MIINKSGRVIYTKYNYNGIELIAVISEDRTPVIQVLTQYLDNIQQALTNETTEFNSFSELCSYYGLVKDLRLWVGNHSIDGSEPDFRLSDKVELVVLNSDNTEAKQIEQYEQVEQSRNVEIFTEDLGAGKHKTVVPPLHLSDNILQKQAEYTAEAIGKKIQEIEDNKKNKVKVYTEVDTEIISEKYLESDFNRVVQGVSAYELARILYIKGALLLVSPPGTGKTTTAIELTKYIQGETNSDRVEVLSFNQTTSYSDFIGGYKKDDNGGWEIQKGTFFKLCDKALANKDNKYILIIDEINRANTESVLGEALSGLSQRNKTFKTNIGLELTVPDNLYIIATMHSADSSITSLDTALVDRFAIYKMPEITLDTSKLGDKQKVVKGVDLVAKAIKDINIKLAEDIYKGKDNQIGNRVLFTNYTSTDELVLMVRFDIQPKVEAKLETLKKQERDDIEAILSKLLDDLGGL